MNEKVNEQSTTEQDGEIRGDNPIKDGGGDRLERTDAAEDFARHVLKLDHSEGAVVGVFGPWGSGKTSFINLTRSTFEQKDVPVLDFNPWMFSGTKQLVERFFIELSEELESKSGLVSRATKAIEARNLLGVVKVLLGVRKILSLWSVRKSLEIYSILFLDPISAGSAQVVKHFELRKKGVSKQKDKIKKALNKWGNQIIVFLDDVDRLSASEIREVLKLVRLTANFPHIIYIIPCDRGRIEQALGENGISGRDYLEKIIQYSFKLPEVPKHLFEKEIKKEIKKALFNLENFGSIDNDVWENLVLPEIVNPLIQNMRDVRRYSIAIQETVIGLEGEVELTDVLALEAIRIFLPDTFELLPSVIDLLTGAIYGPEEYIRKLPEDVDKHRIERMKALIPDIQDSKDVKTIFDSWKNKNVVESMIHRLFPAGYDLLEKAGYFESFSGGKIPELPNHRRVRHERFFRLYLERVGNPGILNFNDAEQALSCMENRIEFDRFLRSLDHARWHKIFRDLQERADSFRPPHVIPGIIVLLNLWSDMSAISAFLFSDEAMERIKEIIDRLLSVLENTSDTEDAIDHIWPEVKSLSSKWVLFRSVNTGEIVSKETKQKIKSDFLCEIREALSISPQELVKEVALFPILYLATDNIDPWRETLTIADLPELTFSFIRVAYRKSIDAPSIPQPDCEFLISLYGGKDVLKTRINDLKNQFENLEPWIQRQGISLEDAKELIDLAEECTKEQQTD